jgi:glucose/arabinose dehydrogenase
MAKRPTLYVLVHCFFFAAIHSLALPPENLLANPPTRLQTSSKPQLNQLSRSELLSGWELLFDGKTTQGWRNFKKADVSDLWKVVDGALVRTGKEAGDLITKDTYKHFELSLEYKIGEQGNSGVMFHVTEAMNKPYQTGPEIQIQDNVDGHDPQKSGWLYQLYKPTPPRWSKKKTILDMTRPPGQWNQIYLRISPGGCQVCVNGAAYYQFKLGNQDWNERVANSKFADWPLFGKAGEGHLCLQDHGDEVAFRNIKVRRLPADGTVPQPIDGELNLSLELAFPKLKWQNWEAFDDAGKMKPLRLVELNYANDDSNLLYATSQCGSVWSFENKPDVVQSTLALNLRDQISDWQAPGCNEQGLLGFAPHPDFKNNRYAYVYYSHADEKRSILSRFTFSKDQTPVADPDSEKILMSIDQPYRNHNGGSIEFGPDGYLYVGLGDGGLRNDPHGNGQNRNSLLGAILRIDVDDATSDMAYGIPSDNPFVGVPNTKPEIYAYGLRNPWKIAFDEQTDMLWCADVGQELWEEIDLIEKGGNYGWSFREGNHPFGRKSTSDNLVEPIWQYDHQLGKSITGGRVFRSDRLPTLSGKYLYADYVAGTVWALTYDPDKKVVTKNERVTQENIPVLAFGESPSGEVLVLTNSPRGQSIYRFVP